MKNSVPAQVDSGTLSEAPETTETVSMAHIEQKNAIPSPNQTGSDVDSTCRSYTNASEEVDNGQVLSTERASSGDIDHVHADARNETSDGIEPSAIIIDAVDQSINSESVPNVQAATKESKTASADARQENSNGMELEMAVEDQNDIVDLQESAASVINNFCSLMPELTRKDSPPPYKSVLRERSTIQPPDCEEVSTTTDNNTVVDVNAITTQPQSNIANSSSVAANRDSTANYNQDERGGTDETKCCDNLDLFCTVCYMCTPSGDTSQEHGNCTRGCCEVS